MDVMTITAIAGPTALITAGVAFGAARQALNGTRERVKEIQVLVAKHIEDDNDLQRELLQRSAALEAKADIILSKLK
jgi:alkylation response protein AidB-like acyl-CoA dehydrogenase